MSGNDDSFSEPMQVDAPSVVSDDDQIDDENEKDNNDAGVGRDGSSRTENRTASEDVPLVDMSQV